MMMKRVVITGMGAVTPLGNTMEETWRTACEGKTGIGHITHFDCTDLPAKTAAEVKNFNLKEYTSSKKHHHMDRFTQFGVAAAIMAIEDAGVVIGKDVEAEQIGVSFGTAIGGVESFEKAVHSFDRGGYKKLSPFATSLIMPNMAACQISIALGTKGANNCSVMACVSSANCIGDAFHIIQRGDAECMLAGGGDASLTPLSIGSFCSMRAISTNPDPATACRPFDLDRNGIVMGEGAGVIVMETYESALRRNAHIYGEIVGFSSVSDAYHVTSPAPGSEGAVRAMARALAQAEMTIAEVDYINAHGTSTKYNDQFETEAVKTVFGERAYHIPISSTKSMTGHMMGASSVVETMLTLKMMENSLILPTLGLQNPDPLCDLDYVPHTAKTASIDVALSNSLGFGSHNSALVFKKVNH
ncbi:beta-ketoacyl-ACP synthase II [Bacillus sp. 1P06AnD]|uniref:beta-ketoacyl-ACP synthase II n=1 Tax=Bacillus sp. 1P06AnD TaxID=3132208 RepID=UPI0039A1D38D